MKSRRTGGSGRFYAHFFGCGRSTSIFLFSSWRDSVRRARLVFEQDVPAALKCDGMIGHAVSGREAVLDA